MTDWLIWPSSWFTETRDLCICIFCVQQSYTFWQWCGQGWNIKAKVSTLEAKAKAWTFKAKANAKAIGLEDKAKAFKRTVRAEINIIF